MKITPKVSLLKSLRGERVNRIGLLGEAIDNSFDANARRVDITIGDHLLTFRDNGIGLNSERLEALFTLGDHVSTGTTALGRFGVGITAQAINAANIIEVDSVSHQGHCRLHANWRQVLRSGEWEVPDPDWRPILVGASTFTVIALRELRTPEPYTQQRLFDDMAEIFYHALQDGKQIVIDGQTIQFVEDPPLDDEIERDLVLSNGRSIKLRAGILRGKSKRWGVFVGFRHRVLKMRCNWGCADYVGLGKMFCRLRLSGPWHLAKFKDDLADQDERDELEAAVEAALRPILEKVNDAAMDAKIDALGDLINQMIPPRLAASRPHRKKNPNPDPEEKRKRKRKQHNPVDPVDSEPQGPARTKQPQQGRLMITFDGRDDQDGIGNYQSGRPDRVNLAKDNLIIGRLIAQRDQQVAASALYVIALLLYESRLRQLDIFEPLGKRVADLLALNIGMLPQLSAEGAKPT